MAGSIKLCVVALSLGLWAITNSAAASAITYSWLGIVDQIDPSADPGFAIGERIKITLTLDDVVPDTNPSPEIGQYDTQFYPPVLVLAVNVGGYVEIGDYQSATVFNNHNGTDLFSVGAGRPQVGSTFQFDFSASNLGALTSDALPLSINPRAFDTATFREYGYIPGFSGRILSATPVPGSVGCFVCALAGLAGVGWWKTYRLRATAP